MHFCMINALFLQKALQDSYGPGITYFLKILKILFESSVISFLSSLFWNHPASFGGLQILIYLYLLSTYYESVTTDAAVNTTDKSSYPEL